MGSRSGVSRRPATYHLTHGRVNFIPVAPLLSSMTATATFGGGCFWCTEAAMKELDGVASVTSGYAGGDTENPTYKAVCSGSTGHAEVVQVIYDSTKVRYERLLHLAGLVQHRDLRYCRRRRGLTTCIPRRAGETVFVLVEH